MNSIMAKILREFHYRFRVQNKYLRAASSFQAETIDGIFLLTAAITRCNALTLKAFWQNLEKKKPG
jgi:hypothetical protein